MARLLGRIPRSSGKDENKGGIAKAFFEREKEAPSGGQSVPGKDNGKPQNWAGSGLGSDWDDRVGAGSAAASIVSVVNFRAEFSRLFRFLKP